MEEFDRLCKEVEKVYLSPAFSVTIDRGGIELTTHWVRVDKGENFDAVCFKPGQGCYGIYVNSSNPSHPDHTANNSQEALTIIRGSMPVD